MELIKGKLYSDIEVLKNNILEPVILEFVDENKSGYRFKYVSGPYMYIEDDEGFVLTGKNFNVFPVNPAV